MEVQHNPGCGECVVALSVQRMQTRVDREIGLTALSTVYLRTHTLAATRVMAVFLSATSCRVVEKAI